MYIEKFKEGDSYVSSNGVYYEDAESFIAIGVLGFCGCGMHEEALDYVRKALQLVHDLEYLVGPSITLKQWNERKENLFSSKGEEYFVWYFLYDRELTEHGGSVPGWLTDKGSELLSDLTDLSEQRVEA